MFRGRKLGVERRGNAAWKKPNKTQKKMKRSALNIVKSIKRNYGAQKNKI